MYAILYICDLFWRSLLDMKSKKYRPVLPFPRPLYAFAQFTEIDCSKEHCNILDLYIQKLSATG